MRTGMISSGRSHSKINAVFKGEAKLVKHIHRVHYSAKIIKNCEVNIVKDYSLIDPASIQRCRLHTA